MAIGPATTDETAGVDRTPAESRAPEGLSPRDLSQNGETGQAGADAGAEPNEARAPLPDAAPAPGGGFEAWLAEAMRRARDWLLTEPSRAQRRRRAILAVGLALAGPALAVLTYTVLSQADLEALDSTPFRLLILVDLLYIALLVGLIGLEIARLVAARRARSAGSKMHLRMVAMFAGVAAAPTLLVAVFFFLVIQLGFNAWFSEQVGSVVRNSNEIAEAYANEHREAIRGQAVALAQQLNAGADRLIGGLEDPRFPVLLEAAIEESAFSDVYVINSSADIVARGSLSFLFAYTPPTVADLDRARSGELVIRQDIAASEMRALVRLDALFDAFLYVARPIDANVLSTLERTTRSVALYNRLEQNRGRWMAQFVAIYLGFAVLVVMAAVYLGFWFAERLARPIGRLAAAAQRIRAGDLFVRVKEERGEDEIALLSRTFNRMTEEVKRKQDALTEANAQLDDRRRFTEAVLSGVTAGIVGLDAEGRVRLFNDAAAALLALDPKDAVGLRLDALAPETAPLLADAAYDPARGVERPLRILRGADERELFVRVTAQREGGGGARAARGAAEPPITGYVVTLDDLTALVAAQRMAAWGDVARRIAHEIKNPLTPIQLAAERLKRKYRDRLGDDAESFERYTETIVRQTGDIGRMVDAFVRFAKMPSPQMSVDPIEPLVREAMVLQEEARADITYRFTGLGEERDLDGAPLAVRCDRGQLLQALTNLLQNAADAIATRQTAEAAEGRASARGEIRVSITRESAAAVTVTVMDNGAGLPAKDRRRLLEPYVTTREKGAGLGLAIVSKIVEEHSAIFELIDAPPFTEGAHPGAAARITLPLAREKDAAAAKLRAAEARRQAKEEAGPGAGLDADGEAAAAGETGETGEGALDGAPSARGDAA